MKRKISQGETQEIRKLIIDNCDFCFAVGTRAPGIAKASEKRAQRHFDHTSSRQGGAIMTVGRQLFTQRMKSRHEKMEGERRSGGGGKLKRKICK